MDIMALTGGMMLGGTLGIACMGLMRQRQDNRYGESRLVCPYFA